MTSYVYGVGFSAAAVLKRKLTRKRKRGCCAHSDSKVWEVCRAPRVHKFHEYVIVAGELTSCMPHGVAWNKWNKITQKNWSVKIRKQEARKTKRRINDRVQETMKINWCFKKAEDAYWSCQDVVFHWRGIYEGTRMGKLISDLLFNIQCMVDIPFI